MYKIVHVANFVERYGFTQTYFVALNNWNKGSAASVTTMCQAVWFKIIPQAEV